MNHLFDHYLLHILCNEQKENIKESLFVALLALMKFTSDQKRLYLNWISQQDGDSMISIEFSIDKKKMIRIKGSSIVNMHSSHIILPTRTMKEGSQGANLKEKQETIENKLKISNLRKGFKYRSIGNDFSAFRYRYASIYRWEWKITCVLAGFYYILILVRFTDRWVHSR